MSLEDTLEVAGGWKVGGKDDLVSPHPRLNCWKCSMRAGGCHARILMDVRRRGRGGEREGMQIADRRGYYPRSEETFRAAARIIAAKFCQDEGGGGGELRFRCERDHLLVSRRQPRNRGRGRGY